MRQPLVRAAVGLAAAVHAATGSAAGPPLRGSLLPKVDEATWEGWTPPTAFASNFSAWPDRPVPEEIMVWCKGFIASGVPGEEVIGGYHTMPILGPGNVPIPGLLGQCAAIDGRNFSSAVPLYQHPDDARFWSWLKVAGGQGAGVTSAGSCGMSHNICCSRHGCWGGSAYGDVTCEKRCAEEEEMKVLRQSCWGAEDVAAGWPSKGKECAGGPVVAAKAYFHGRGGNPCGEVLGVKPPAAKWDIGVAVFPTKRMVTIDGFVDDAPSYECYAAAKDSGKWGEPVTLAQLPADNGMNIALELAGYSDRPVNPGGKYFHVPEPADRPTAAGGREIVV